MTRVITVKNVNHALGEGFAWLKVAGRSMASRAGPVLVAPGPVVTEYLYPTQRVLFNADRDANAVFHLLESIWMLAGKSAVAWLLPYNARMAEYAEPDGTVHGAYGHRWRNAFGMDQILEIIWELQQQPDSRQCVMQMWSAVEDLGVTKKDRPCNTHVYFDTLPNAHGARVLNMTVCCRSNDALWGAYGANAVHFSILQELMAAGVGVPVGVYRQMSNNFHAYTAVPVVSKFLDYPPAVDPEWVYPAPVVPLLSGEETVEGFLSDCAKVTNDHTIAGLYTTRFFREVVVPLKQCYDARKVHARTWRVGLDHVAACDWKLAFIEWAQRRDNVSE